MNFMGPPANKSRRSAAPKRPYDLGKRLEQSSRKRQAILVAARKQLASKGFLQLTMDGLARQSRVTRQTVHNLFGTKTELLEALFDELAREGGMEGMRHVMQESDPARMATAFATIFTGFWSKDRLLLRRIHGIAAIDPEFASALAARNRRRWMAATRVIERLGLHESDIANLYALTSFEFFDVLSEVSGSPAAAGRVLEIVRRLFGGV
jgi:AcrR family transcriptional regulator